MVRGGLWIIIKYFVCHADLIFKTMLLNHTQALATAAETTSCFPFTSSDAPGMIGEALDSLLQVWYYPFISKLSITGLPFEINAYLFLVILTSTIQSCVYLKFMLKPSQFFLWMAKRKTSVFEEGNKLNLFLLNFGWRKKNSCLVAREFSNGNLPHLIVAILWQYCLCLSCTSTEISNILSWGQTMNATHFYNNPLPVLW